MVVTTPISIQDNAAVLIDAHGRRLRKLRVSLTEACNYRCFYCMPVQTTFPSDPQQLTPPKLVELVKGLVDYGIEAVRVTGGEPTLRAEFSEIVHLLGEIPGIRLGLTTNGQFLERHVPALAAAHFSNVNVSLDSLDAKTFHSITHGGDLDKVLSSIFAARSAGLTVKINCVVAREINDQELEPFHDFSAQHKIEVRFLELMKIGPARHRHAAQFVPASELVARLQERHTLLSSPVEDDATAWIRTTSEGARLGFIASESQPFCGHCSRLRLSSRGFLRACLFKEDGLPLAELEKPLWPDTLRQVANLKPFGRLSEIAQAMNQIGG